jgi:hypothetical protein
MEAHPGPQKTKRTIFRVEKLEKTESKIHSLQIDPETEILQLLSSLHSMEERPIDMHVINIGVHSY